MTGRQPIFAMRAWLVALCCVVATACATNRGVADFEAYRSAFEKTYSTSATILDQLAIHERALFLAVTDASPSRFNPNLAAYYTEAVDPPGTAAFRRSLDTVKAYNDLLYGLASGQTADALVAKVEALKTHAVAANREVSLFGGIVRAGAVGQLTTAAAGLEAAFQAFLPVVDIALTFRSRQQFRRYLIAYYPLVHQILLELRGGTQEIFPVLTYAIETSKRTTPPFRYTPDQMAKIENYRTLLSDWVILIDGSIVALNQAKEAVEAPGTLSDAITGLTITAVELEAAAEAARKHIAELAAN